jgi:hypothetical protein
MGPRPLEPKFRKAMKPNKILTRLAILVLASAALSLKSCEPDYCAECFDYSGVFRNKAMVICADDMEELNYMMDEAEYSMGYVCEYK